MPLQLTVDGWRVVLLQMSEVLPRFSGWSFALRLDRVVVGLLCLELLGEVVSDSVERWYREVVMSG